MSGPYRILVTGTRDMLTPGNKVAINRPIWSEIRKARTQGRPVILVHGDCPTGVDAHVKSFRIGLDVTIEAHPANWAMLGKAAGPMRNQEMVDLGAEVCLGFPRPGSRGTHDCIRRAELAGIRTIVVGLP